MYSHYRRLRSIGRARAWYGARADSRAWDEETYPPPPEMRYHGLEVIWGSWFEIKPSYIRVDRYKYRRGIVIESRKKIKRLRKRREARRYRAYQKSTGKL